MKLPTLIFALLISGPVIAQAPPRLVKEAETKADLSIGGVSLNVRCEPKVPLCIVFTTKLKKLVEKRPTTNHKVEIANKSETEVMIGHFTMGSEIGEFQKITVEKRKSTKLDKAALTTFKTENGIKLGQSPDEVKSHLGAPAVEKLGKKIGYITYKNEDICAGQTYTARYDFKGDKLEKFTFGCELSTKF